MYPYGMGVFKVCENEMENVCNAKETLEKNYELYVTSSIYYMKEKKKCNGNEKKCKIIKKKVIKYEKKIYNGNKKTCKITEKML